jgi:Tfp pilus assembly protein PilF
MRRDRRLDPPEEVTWGQRAARAAPWLVALITLAAFLPALQAGFVSWDDDKNFLANPHYRGIGWTQLRWMWTTFLLGHYVPLSWMTLGVDYALWGMNPAGYHLTNLLPHCANAVLLYVIARRLLPLTGVIRSNDGVWAQAAPATLAAVLFSIHPLRVESVAWVTERRDVLSGLFFLSCVLCYLRAFDSPERRRRWYWASVALFSCALLSKGTAVTVPAVLLILNLYPLRRLGGRQGWTTSAARAVYLEVAPFAVLGAAASAMTLVALQRMVQLPLLGKVAVSAYSLSFYLWKTIVPVNLSPIYAMPARIDPAAGVFILSYAIVLATIALAWAARRRMPGLSMGWVAFVAISLPMLGIHQNGPQIAADRYTYHAAPVLAMLAAAGVVAIYRRLADTTARASLVAVCAGTVTAIGALTWRQTHVWHDSSALWSHVLALDSASSYGHNNWGNLLMEQNRIPEATTHYRQAIALTSEYAQAHNNLGIALARQGQLTEAIEHYQRALAIEPEYDEPHGNWGIALASQGDLEGAIGHYALALKSNENNADAHVNWGNALVRLGRPNDAAGHYQHALAIRPDHADAHLNWGVMLAQQGKFAEAIDQFQRTLAIKPQHPEATQYLEQAMRLQRGR